MSAGTAKTGDGTVAGLLEEAGAIEVLSLSAIEKHIYLINLITDNILNRFTVNVLDTDGLTELADNDFSESTLSWQAPSTATYYLVIREDLEGGSFDLSTRDQGMPPPDADLNDDFRVDHDDLLLFQSQWQEVYPTPTPNS